MPLKTTKVVVHLPNGKTLTFPEHQLLQVSLVPFPAVAVREKDGTIKRYLMFPLETVDEETAIIPGGEGLT